MALAMATDFMRKIHFGISSSRVCESRNGVDFSSGSGVCIVPAAVPPSWRIPVRENNLGCSLWRIWRGRNVYCRERGRCLGAVFEQVLAETERTEDVPESPPSDSLAMYFTAEGSLAESAVSKLTKTLEAVEGVSDVVVTINEGGSTVSLTKQMSIQATGVASGLVEIIQKAGFKLQSLNLGFDEDDGDDEDLYDYDLPVDEDTS